MLLPQLLVEAEQAQVWFALLLTDLCDLGEVQDV